MEIIPGLILMAVMGYFAYMSAVLVDDKKKAEKNNDKNS